MDDEIIKLWVPLATAVVGALATWFIERSRRQSAVELAVANHRLVEGQKLLEAEQRVSAAQMEHELPVRTTRVLSRSWRTNTSSS